MAANDDDGGGKPVDIPLSFQAIEVDLQQMADFATVLQSENDANLRPYAGQIIDSYADGVCFGERSASAEMQVTREVYHEALSRAVDNLREFVVSSKILVEAVKQISAEYARSDGAADQATQIRQAQTALSDAAGQAEAARIAAMHVSNLPSNVTDWLV